MSATDPRAMLDQLVSRSGASYAALSRMLGRNAAYLQQYARRGSPRVLPEVERARLAAFFGVDEGALGGPQRAPGAMALRRLDLSAAAGHGMPVDAEHEGAALMIDPAVLRGLGLLPSDAAMLNARGDSMLPTIQDGDTMLVDERARTPKPGGIFVIRHEGALVVKRVAMPDGLPIATSDNPAYPAFPLGRHSVIVGRVVWLSRALR